MKLPLNGLVGLFLLMALPACAGKSITDGGTQQTNGGNSHSGGAASVAGASANGGGSGSGGSGSGGSGATAGASPISKTCPDARPASGSACNYVGGLCSYALNECSSLALMCENGVWREVHLDGAALTCSNFGPDQGGIPKDGDSCKCLGTLDCTFDQCSTQGSVHAVCDNTTWHVTSEPCTDAPCGTDGLRCKTGEACIIHPGGIGASFKCAADPCAEKDETLSCACASSLCKAPSERCVMIANQVECLCDTC